MMKKDRYIRMKNWLFVSTLQNWIKEIKWIHLQGCSYIRKMHVGWKVRWAGMVATKNSKQVLRTILIFIWIGLLSIELLEIVENYFIQIFSVWEYAQYQNLIESDSPQNHSFPFSYRMIASRNPAGDYGTSDPAGKFYHHLVVNSNPVSLFFAEWFWKANHWFAHAWYCQPWLWGNCCSVVLF